MTGLSRSTAGLDARRKRILFRAWHRGTREMDLLMGRYAESVIEAMNDAELTQIEALIELDDHDLFSWLSSGVPVPEGHDSPVYQALKAFHTHAAPLDL